MKEAIGDVWAQEADAILIPTNGVLTSSGLVMGTGMALEAKTRFPNLPREVGKLVDLYGNLPFYFAGYKLMTFPTKRHWKDNSSLSLIEVSARRAKEIADKERLKSVVLPRVGCGLGGLAWEDVKKVLFSHFDDRFLVVTHE